MSTVTEYRLEGGVHDGLKGGLVYTGKRMIFGRYSKANAAYVLDREDADGTWVYVPAEEEA